MIDFRTFTDTELDTVRVQVLTEIERRQRMSQIPAQVAELATAYRADGGNPDVLLEAIATD